MSYEPPLSVFGALADPVRLRTVELLGNGPLSAGELAIAAGMSPSAMSRHLRVLGEAGLIVDQGDPSDARLRVFRLRVEELVAARAWLDQVQAQWNEQLAAFRRHVEGRKA